MKRNLIRSLLLFSALMPMVLLTEAPSAASRLPEIRAAIQHHGAKWIASDTSVSVLPDHLKKLRVGLMKHTATGNEPLLATPVLTSESPATVDWKSAGFVTSVKDQGNCGSCWAMATTAALESYFLIANGLANGDQDRAEEVLVSCSGAGSCNGGYINMAANYIRDVGLPSEQYFPYTAASSDNVCTNAQQDWQSDTYRTVGWSYVSTVPVSLDVIKSALSTHGPLVSTMEVYSDFFSYRSGIYEYSTGAYEGGHAVVIVGYTDDATINGGGYFTVKNSWGTGWGESGYFHIAYSQINSPVYFGEWTIAYEQQTPAAEVPDAPSSLTVTPSGNQLILSWADNSTDEDGFRIERCQGPNCTGFVQIGSVSAGVVAYSDGNVSPSTTFTYRVRAYNSSGTSAYSNTAYATANGASNGPSTPGNVIATPVSKSQIRLSWTDNSSGESGFKIGRCQGSSCTSFTEIARVKANTVAYLDSKLPASTTFTYCVRSYNSLGNSDYSGSASATTLAAPKPPAAPGNLSGMALSRTRISLSWTDNSDDEKGFKVERCRGVGCTAFTQIARVRKNVTTYTNGGLRKGNQYSYRVRAYNAAGSSPYSPEMSATTLP